MRRKKKQGMSYTKVLRPDSGERAREPKKKPLEKRYDRREQARSSGQGECEKRREEERKRERERARGLEARGTRRFGGEMRVYGYRYITGGRGRRVGVRAKG